MVVHTSAAAGQDEMQPQYLNPFIPSQSTSINAVYQFPVAFNHTTLCGVLTFLSKPVRFQKRPSHFKQGSTDAGCVCVCVCGGGVLNPFYERFR